LTTETFVAAAAAFDWVFVFFVGSGLGEHCTLCFPVNVNLLAMLDTRLLVNCKDNVFDLFEQCNFDITSGGEHVTMPTPMGKTFNFFLPGVFTSLNLPFFFPDEPTSKLFFDSDFGCVFAMTHLIMTMICVLSKSDWLLTTHLTPSVINVPSTKPFCGKKKSNQVIPIPLFVTPNHFNICLNFGDTALMSISSWIYP
jgi:hypothetical protein